MRQDYDLLKTYTITYPVFLMRPDCVFKSHAITYPELNSNEGQGWPEGLAEGTLSLYTHPKPTFL